MRLLFINILSIFIMSSSFAYECKNDINLTKEQIAVGNIFVGSSVSLYGIMCDENYLITTYKPNVKYKIQKKIKNELGVVVYEKNPSTVNYYGYLSVTGNIANYEDFVSQNELLNRYLYKNNNISINDTKNIQIYGNGIFRHKVYIPKNASPGQYVNKMYIFNKETNELDHLIITGFDVVLDNDVGFIYKLSKQNPKIYTILTLSLCISAVCFLSFVIDNIQSIRSKMK